MKIVIIEDEGLAVERLTNLIAQYDDTIEILTQLDSVESAVEWFNKNDAPDLAFFDIQLADGLSFNIFEKTKVTCPIIFTTAYNEYALRAFKVNSIDYLLKPLDFGELSKAIDQFREQNIQASVVPPDLSAMMETMKQMSKKYKSRFIVKSGQHISAVALEDIAYFYSEDKMVRIKTFDSKKHLIDYTLDQLQEMVDPLKFFRVNRKYITSFKAIQQATAYSNSRLKVTLFDLPKTEEILISREKVGKFKDWLDG